MPLAPRSVPVPLSLVRWSPRGAGGWAPFPLALHHDLGDGAPRGVGAQLHGRGAGEQRDVGVLQRRPHAEHLGVGLGVHEAGEAVAGRAAHAGAVGHVVLAQHHPARGVEGVQAGRGEVLGELCDARLVRDGGVGVGRARRRFGGVLAARPVHFVELLGLRVVGLHLLVGDRPCGGDAAVVAQLAEVLFAHPVQRRAVQLGGAPDVVVDLRLEGLAGGVIPGVGGDVAVLDEHVGGRPVLRLAGQPVAALEQQDALARRREVARERAAARAAADDDDVVGVHHLASAPRPTWRRPAEPEMAAR